LDEAKKMGAMALFGEKYGDRVRVVKIGDFSVELCGGIHLDSTGEIGLFKIMSQEAAAAGIRRVEAIVGVRLFMTVRRNIATIREIAHILGADREIIKKVRDVQERLKSLEKTNQEQQLKLARVEAAELLAKAQKEQSRIIVKKFDSIGGEALRLVADHIRERLKDGIGLLYAEEKGKINYLLFVGEDLVNEYPAHELIKEVSDIMGGGGGGRPHMAEGGGGDPQKLDRVITYLKDTTKK
jgi:alanyl-tRNA synthetase